METKVIITQDADLLPGDEIEMHYGIIGTPFWRAVQIAAIEKNLEKEPRFELLSYSFQGPNERTIVMRIKILAPPAPKDWEPGDPVQEAGIPVAAIVYAIGAAATAAFVWLSLKEVYKIVQTPGGAAAVAGLGAAGAGAAALLLFYLWKRSA